MNTGSSAGINTIFIVMISINNNIKDKLCVFNQYDCHLMSFYFMMGIILNNRHVYMRQWSQKES